MQSERVMKHMRTRRRVVCCRGTERRREICGLRTPDGEIYSLVVCSLAARCVLWLYKLLVVTDFDISVWTTRHKSFCNSEMRMPVAAQQLLHDILISVNVSVVVIMNRFQRKRCHTTWHMPIWFTGNFWEMQRKTITSNVVTIPLALTALHSYSQLCQPIQLLDERVIPLYGHTHFSVTA